jgi:hypothetical protein
MLKISPRRWHDDRDNANHKQGFKKERGLKKTAIHCLRILNKTGAPAPIWREYLTTKLPQL